MRSLFPFASVALLAACSGQTQLVVVVETNLDVPGEIDSVDVVVTAPDGLQTVVPQEVGGAGDPSFPLTLGVTPEADALGPIGVAAVGRLDGVEVVRTTATGLTLVPGETRVLQLALVRSCMGRTCPTGERCGVDGCASATTDVGALPVWEGAPPPFDDSDPCLAMPWDVDGDGQGDVACGGTDCDDTQPLAFEGATEECNSFDDNCDGTIDEDCDCTPLGSTETCTTSCDSAGTRTCEMAGWSTCVPPAETCNGADDDCDGMADEAFDYVASPSVNVTNDMTDPGTYTNEPALVWTGDAYGLAFDDELAGDGTHFTLLDAAGAMTIAPVFLGPGRAPAIAYGGGVFAVVFWHRFTDSAAMVTNDRINLRIVGADGTPVTDVIRVEGNASVDPHPRVVWDGSAFVVSYYDGGIYHHRFAPDGTEMMGRVQVPASAHGRPDLDFDGSVYAFAWSNGGDVRFTRGSETAGFPMDGTTVAAGADAESAGMSATDSGYMVAWMTRSAPLAVMALPLDATGAPIGTPLLVSPSASPRDTTQYPNRWFLEVARAPGQILVGWVDARDMDAALYAARLAPDGTTLQGPTRIADTMPAAGGPPYAAWAGDRWGLAWEELGPHPRTEAYFATLACP